jgi:hypothetical protein
VPASHRHTQVSSSDGLKEDVPDFWLKPASTVLRAILEQPCKCRPHNAESQIHFFVIVRCRRRQLICLHCHNSKLQGSLAQRSSGFDATATPVDPCLSPSAWHLLHGWSMSNAAQNSMIGRCENIFFLIQKKFRRTAPLSTATGLMRASLRRGRTCLSSGLQGELCQNLVSKVAWDFFSLRFQVFAAVSTALAV